MSRVWVFQLPDTCSTMLQGKWCGLDLCFYLGVMSFEEESGSKGAASFSVSVTIYFSFGATAPLGLGPPHSRGL